MTPQFPLQAATPFEQKVLYWPLEWLWRKGLRKRLERSQRTKPLLGFKTTYRLVQLIVLLFSAMWMYISFFLWKNLIPFIWIIVNDPIIGLEYVPPMRQHRLDIFFRWIALVISIYGLVLAIILLRIRNAPLLWRFTLFCGLGGMPSMLNQLWYFGMPAFMFIGVRTFFLVLMSMSSFSLLLVVFYMKAWMEEEWKGMGILPNANEADK